MNDYLHELIMLTVVVDGLSSGVEASTGGSSRGHRACTPGLGDMAVIFVTITKKSFNSLPLFNNLRSA